MNSAAHTNKIHEGRNVKRFREMLGIKQEALAYELGDDWNQKKISVLETRETIDVPLLQQISAALKIPVEAFQNFDEEQAINLISNNATFENCQQPAFFNHHPNFNPLDKLVEAYDEIKRLNAELLKVKDEQIRLLQSLVEKK
jgi:transcriptional regulator with XRE-family HTH domain